MADAYTADLAYIHDAGYGGFARRAAPAILRLFKRKKITKGLVIDLGCGSGIWARQLVDAGYEVLGIDQSPDMVALARTLVPEGRFVSASHFDAELPPCVAVTSMGECLSYQFDKHHSAKTLRKLFQRVQRALAPGGVFVFDMVGPGRVPGGRQHHCRVEDDWAVVVDAEENGRFLRRSITSFRMMGALYRRAHEVHRLRLFTPTAIASLLTAARFQVEIRRGYGRANLGPGWTVFIAGKSRRPGDTPEAGRRTSSDAI